MRLNLRVGKMKRILRSDWLRGSLARDFPRWPRIFIYLFYLFIYLSFWPYNRSFIDQACSKKMAAYSPRSIFAFSLTKTSSGSI